MKRRWLGIAIAAIVLGGLALAGWFAYESFFGHPDVQEVGEPVVPTSKGGQLPTPEEFEQLARDNPVAMLEACLHRYEKEGIKGFTCTLDKQERIEGKLHDRELIRLTGSGELPAKPGEAPAIRIRMIWESGFQTDPFGNNIAATLYVSNGKKSEMIAYRPTSRFLKEMPVDPKSERTRAASRYCIADAGLYRGMLRTYDAWKKRQAAGQLHAEFLGTQSPAEVGGRPCYAIRRNAAVPEVDSFSLDEAPNPKANAERDGATHITAYYDVERWLQVGTVLYRADGSLLAQYYFRDVVLSKTEFKPDPFTIEAVKAAVR
ncbi:MAG TPA: DUF1571 domain-containing protein [Urbifossiella sp.]|nr:DUF1571 domain-containing protein [Urbifossiella sp.]